MLTFYVYEHWRPDNGTCFYVGKGTGVRAFAKGNRNSHHRRITARLSKLGLFIDVRFIREKLSEEDAFAFEIERIAFWRSAGIEIVNQTAGGDGSVGHIQPPHTAEQRQRLSDAVRKNALSRSPEHLAKISAALKGRKLSAEHIAKLKTALRPPITEEHRAKLRAGQANRIRTPEHAARISASIKALHAARPGTAWRRQTEHLLINKIMENP